MLAHTLGHPQMMMRKTRKCCLTVGVVGCVLNMFSHSSLTDLEGWVRESLTLLVSSVTNRRHRPVFSNRAKLCGHGRSIARFAQRGQRVASEDEYNVFSITTQTDEVVHMVVAFVGL